MDGDSWNLAVFGASGALGRQVMLALEGEGIAAKRLIPVGADRSVGGFVSWRGTDYAVVTAAEVPDVDIAILAAPKSVSAAEWPRHLARGALVIDLSGARHGDDLTLPLIWPGLSSGGLEDHPGGFALPCALASTVAPLVDAVAKAGALASEVDVVAVESAGSAGVAGQQALSSQTVGLLNGQIVESGPFSGVLAFNLLDGTARGAEDPIAARFEDELAVLVPGLDARPRLTTLVAPMFAGHAVALTLRFDGDAPSFDRVVAALEAHPDIDFYADGVALRDALDQNDVLCAPPRCDADGVVRLFAVADPLHRIGDAAAGLLGLIIERDLW